VLVAALVLVANPALAGSHGERLPMAPEEGQMVALITGSTSGLGEAVARELAERGVHVILHGRSIERGEALLAEIEAAGGSARFYPADFALMSNVQQFAEQIKRDYDRLDLLVNNAGLSARGTEEAQITEDGNELLLQVNYLSHFLLTHELLPLLAASAPARIIHTASAAQAPMDFDDPNMDNNYSSGRAYGQSKLAQITYSNALAKRIDGSDVTTVSFHPGTFMPTRMVLGAGIEPQEELEVGVNAMMNLITSDDIENGAYFNRQEQIKAHDQAYDEEAQRKLWQLSERLVGIR
jgi:NAD(P)-dependent dehydrogenase (short-subunit alcohol dehydrogenase family)